MIYYSIVEMSKMKKNKEVLVGLVKKPVFYFCVIFIVMNLFFTRQILNANGVDGFLLVAAMEVLVECLSIWVLVRMRRRGIPIEKQFLFLALVLGVLFIIILPPGQSPDEITHFRRAYGISDGILVPDEEVNSAGAIGSDIPVTTNFFDKKAGHGTYADIVEQITLSSEETSKQPYTSAALYNFICYIPQVLAALIGKLLGFSVLGMAYLMEIFNFVVWTFLAYFAIKLIPKFKSVAVFVALLPITLQEATSLSPDALTIGLSMFFVSYVLYLAYERKGVLGKKQLVILSVVSLVIGFCKIVYLPLVLLMLIIPSEKFGSKKRKWIFLGVLFGVVAVLNLAWLMVSARYLVEYRDGVNSKEQLMDIIKNPLKYTMVMFRTVSVHGQKWMLNMFGLTLGYFNFVLPAALLFVSFAIAVLLVGQRSEALKIRKFDRAIFVIVFLIIVALIFTSLYMQWTPYGDEVIDGIQGRYFLPILLLIPLMICRTNTRGKYPVIISADIVLYYSLFVNIVACVTIFAQNV